MAAGPSYRYRSLVVAVVDGDTVDLDAELERIDADLGFHVRVRRQTLFGFRSRLLARLDDGTVVGLDAPERFTTDGKAASAFLRQLLPVGAEVFSTTYRDPGDRYGRWLALLEVQGVDIGSTMMEAGHAVRRFAQAPLAVALDR